MDLKLLNQSASLSDSKSKTLKRLKDLLADVVYPIVGAKVCKTKFGEALLLELEENSIFLPNRVTETFKPEVENIVAKNYGMVFKGLKKVGKYQPATIFEIVKC